MKLIIHLLYLHLGQKENQSCMVEVNDLLYIDEMTCKHVHTRDGSVTHDETGVNLHIVVVHI